MAAQNRAKSTAAAVDEDADVLPRNFAKSASRALDVLLYLAERQSPARAWEIARELGCAASSADQLLKTMVLSGYLIFRSDDKTYVPSPKLSQFGHWLTKIYPDSASVGELLKDLHSETGCSVSFGVESDGFMVISNCISVQADPFLSHGAKVPMLRSALGGAVLAARSNTDIRRALQRARRLRTIDGAITPALTANVIRSINQFREMGYAWRVRDQYSAYRPLPAGEGSMSLAVRLRPTGLGQAMALGMAGVEQDVRLRQEQYATLMHALADKYGIAAT